MTQEDKIIDRIKKLLKLAAGTDKPEEAASAAAAAAKLQFEYKLYSVTLEEPPEPIESTFLNEASGGIASWIKILTNGLCAALDCKKITITVGIKEGRRRNRDLTRIRVYGSKSDVETFVALYAHLTTEIARMALSKKGMGKSYISAFSCGVAETVSDRLRASKKQMVSAAGEPGLVLVRDILARVEATYKAHHPKTTTTYFQYGNNYGGRIDGQIAGKNIPLSQNNRLNNARLLPAARK